MKRRTVKIMSLALAVSACITATGCKKGGNVADSGVTEINIWTSGGGDAKIMEQLINEFNETTGKENDVFINYQMKDSSAVQVALSSGGEAPDFFGGNLVEMADKGQIVSIEDMPGGKELVEPYREMSREGVNMHNGKIYCIPNSSQVYALVYNKDMFKAAGIVDENGEAKPPETWDEMREDAKKLTNVQEKQFGIIFPMKWGPWFDFDVIHSSMAATGYFDGYNPKTGTYDYSSLQPVLDAIIGMRDDGSCYPGSESLDNDPARARFAEGGIGMKLAVSWDAAVFNEQFVAKCDWGVAPLPSTNKDEKYYQGMAYGYTSYINAQSAEEKADAIMLVYKWFASDELAQKKYKLGSALPWKYDIIKDVKFDKEIKGWKEFADIINISKVVPIKMQTDTSSAPQLSTEFINHVWSDNTKTTKQVLDEWTKARNDGIKTYQEIHPDYDPSVAIDENYNVAR